AAHRPSTGKTAFGPSVFTSTTGYSPIGPSAPVGEFTTYVPRMFEAAGQFDEFGHLHLAVEGGASQAEASYSPFASPQASLGQQSSESAIAKIEDGSRCRQSQQRQETITSHERKAKERDGRPACRIRHRHQLQRRHDDSDHQAYQSDKA